MVGAMNNLKPLKTDSICCTDAIVPRDPMTESLSLFHQQLDRASTLSDSNQHQVIESSKINVSLVQLRPNTYYHHRIKP
jgi:hypothetical protein